MLRYEDLLFCTIDELLEELDDCAAIADRVTAHSWADELLIVAFHRAMMGEINETQAARIEQYYRAVEKWYG